MDATRPLTETRASGVQLHITSLPGGRLGQPARDFVDWLVEAGQSVWQVLPVSVPDQHRSPYKSPSAFAASPALLEEPDAPVSRAGARRLRRAGGLLGRLVDVASVATSPTRCGSTASGRPCASTPTSAASRSSATSPSTSRPTRADERAWPQFFRDDAVAGCPPDAYAATGQLWGNPLYRWDVLRDDGYRWWIERLRRTFALFDLVRVDHFRGFAAYWAIPAGDDTALNGQWEQGPGRAVFDAALRRPRPAARPRRGPRRHRPAGHRPAQGARASPAWRCCSSPSSRPTSTTPTTRRTTSPTRSSTPAPTTTTRSAAGGGTCPTTVGSWPATPVAGRASAPTSTPSRRWAFIELALRGAVRAGDDAGPGRARPWARRPG